MDTFEFNKFAGAFLGAVFVLMAIGILGDMIFDSPAPKNAGYAIEVAESVGGSDEADAPSGPEPIAPLLASADVEAGEKVFKKCAACHTVDDGGANKVGPNLWNIVNQPIAMVDGFNYSAALKEFADGGSTVWTYDHLNGFLEKPKAYVKGTAMGFAGVKKTEDRANLVAYLRTLAATPAALPEAEAATEETPAAETTGEQASDGSESAPAADGETPAANAESDTGDAATSSEGGSESSGSDNN